MSRRVGRGAGRLVVAALAAAVALGGCAGAGAVTPVPPATRVPASPTPATPDAGPAPLTLDVDGRPVLLYLPDRAPEAPAALVVALHGYTGQAAGVVEFLGLSPAAGRRGILVAAPQASTDSEGNTFWNAGRACCDFHDSGVDDEGHILRVIDAVAAAHPVDPGRVFVVGHSNGGFLAHRLACGHADRIAAIVSVAGALDTGTDCAPARPVSVLQVHGDADETVGYDGGDINGNPFTGAEATVGRWREADGCAQDPTTGARLDADDGLAGDDLTPTGWDGCRDGAGVALWTIAGGSHAPRFTAAFTGAVLEWLDAHRRGA